MRFLIFALAAIPSAAFAWSDTERFSAANSLGAVMASESACGLSFNPDGISAYISKTVPEDDMEFAPLLNSMTKTAQFSIKQMSASALVAHCAQMRRVAISYGFVDA